MIFLSCSILQKKKICFKEISSLEHIWRYSFVFWKTKKIVKEQSCLLLKTPTFLKLRNSLELIQLGFLQYACLVYVYFARS